MKDKIMLPGKERRGPISWMTRNPVAANIVMLILVAGGLLQAFNGYFVLALNNQSGTHVQPGHCLTWIQPQGFPQSHHALFGQP